MLLDRNKIDINNVSTNFLNQEYINNHRTMWGSMSKKYEFLDKGVMFDESVELTKNILNNEIKNLDKTKTYKIRLR